MKENKPVVTVDFTLNEILSAAVMLIDNRLYLDGVNLASSHLTWLRGQITTDDWKNVLIPQARRHPIKRYFDLDPLTNRCFTWPKGYQGDAVTIDHIYYPEQFSVEGVGREILEITMARNAPSAVRMRKDFAKGYLADLIGQGVKSFVSLGGGT